MRVGPLVSIAVTIALLIVISEFGLPSPQAFASLQVISPAPHAPGIHAGSGGSYNWAGYVVTGALNSITDVKGSWVVPAIIGSCSSTNQYSSFWAGIDGYNSNTVEQIGTDSDCQDGAPTYYAWYEFYPQPSFLITKIDVSPGDNIAAEVSYTGGEFVATISDVTTGQSFTTTAKVSSAARSTAEWITEAPSSGGTILPLADFGISHYGQDRTLLTNTNYATVGGNYGQISFFGPSVQEITMVTKSLATKAQPSSLSTDGTSFDVSMVGSSSSTSTSGSTTSVTSSSTRTTAARTGSTTTTTTTTTAVISSSTTSVSTTRSATTAAVSSSSTTASSTTSSSKTVTSSSSSTTTTATTTTTTSTTTTATTTTTTSTTTTSTSPSSTTALSVAISTDHSSYEQKSSAYVTATVTANGTPVGGASVVLSVTAPDGSILKSSGTTGANGQVVFKYRIGESAPRGTYTATVQASLSGYATGSASTTFQVTKD